MIEEKKIEYGNDAFIRFFQRKVDAFERLPKPHCHPAFEISYFLEGHGEYLVNGRHYDITPGCAFLFASNEQHYITRIDSGCGMHTLNLHFTREFLVSQYEQLGHNYLRIFIDRNSEFSNCLAPGSIGAQKVLEMLTKVEEMFNQSDNEVYLSVRPCLETFLNDLRILFRLKPSVLPYQVFSQIAPVCDYINENLQNNLTLEELANHVHLNKSYLSTMFRRTTGTTLWEYIQARRINRAASLIAENRMSITEAAYASGFNNISNFNRTFRSILGTTPTAFKASHPLSVPEESAHSTQNREQESSP